MAALLLNTRARALGIHTVCIGGLHMSTVGMGEVFKAALLVNAASLVLCHTHPSGDPEPSPDDVAVTKKLKEAGEILQIQLLDHIILGEDRFVSLKERGAF